MSTDISQESGLPSAGPADTLLERLAEKLGGTARASTVFGEPVERDGVTVIPVAKARWGFGGGSGTGRSRRGGEPETGSGTGGGGGLTISPAGYIEVKGGTSRFHAIREPMALAPLVIVAGVTAVLLLRGLTRLLRH
jgi:uncharacterized spore protein YtfJ